MMKVETVGRRSSQLRAIWGTVLPVSCGDLVERVDDFVEVFLGDLRADVERRASIEAAVGGERLPRRILPVRRPQPSGDQTSAPTPWSSARGISSHS